MTDDENKDENQEENGKETIDIDVKLQGAWKMVEFDRIVNKMKAVARGLGIEVGELNSKEDLEVLGNTIVIAQKSKAEAENKLDVQSHAPAGSVPLNQEQYGWENPQDVQDLVDSEKSVYSMEFDSFEQLAKVVKARADKGDDSELTREARQILVSLYKKAKLGEGEFEFQSGEKTGGVKDIMKKKGKFVRKR